MKQNIYKTVLSAACLALCLVLPFLTGQIPEIGNTLCPMHIPVLLCGFICGWQYGFTVGFVAPLLRSAAFSMPVMFPNAFAMAFELAAYGLISGLLYKFLAKKTIFVYINLFLSLLGGRMLWGTVMFILYGLGYSDFSFNMFITDAFLNAVPGIAIQLLLVPPVVMAVKKANIKLNKHR